MINSELILRTLKKKGLRQYQLAEKAGITPASLSQIISHQRKNPQMESIRKIANALDISIDSLMESD